MTPDYAEIAGRVVSGAKALRETSPDTMKAFAGLGAAAYALGALDPKVKELMALAISIAGRCDGCVAYHTKAAFERGARRDEVAETITVAIHMGGGPSMVYGAEALSAFDQFSGDNQEQSHLAE